MRNRYRHALKFTLHTSFFIVFFSIFFIIGIFGYLSFQRSKFKGKVYQNVYINTTNVATLDEDSLKKLLNSYQHFLSGKSISLVYQDQIATYSGELLKLNLPIEKVSQKIMSIGREGSLANQYFQTGRVFFGNQKTLFKLIPSYDIATISAHLDLLAQTYDKDPINARFEKKGEKVVDFAIHTDGHQVDKAKTMAEIDASMASFLDLDTQTQNLTIKVSDKIIKPSFFLSDTNSLGIVELVGKGISNYHHSSAERIHNLSLGSERLHGTLIPPNSIFSFNQALGDVSAATGYKQAYIISQGRTQLGDGGGICQTSSTFFRAVLNAGLPVLERKAHAYRVRYYENDADPGFDATVYSPSPDLKIKNDTPAHLLLWIENDKKNLTLTYNLYGKKDGRIVTITNYKKWGAAPAPPAIHQEDPSLRRGVTKQVDFAVGGLNTSFDYEVMNNGQVTFKKTFVSNFRPWPAVYLVGIGDF